MRVLMFGWEFPPHIAGGLGTACYGMTRGLARNGVEVVFVMPPTTTSSFAAAGHTSGPTYGNSATPSPENTAPT